LFKQIGPFRFRIPSLYVRLDMAPKAAASKAKARCSAAAAPVMKKPAAAASQASASKRLADVQGGAPKKLRAVSQGGRRESITKLDLAMSVSMMAGAHELPPKMREMLSTLLSCSVGIRPDIDEQTRRAVFELVFEGIASVDAELAREVEDAQAKIDAVNHDRDSRAAAEKDAEDHLNELKSVIVQSKMDIKAASNAFSTFQYGLSQMKSVQEKSQGKLKTVTDKVEQLQEADQNLYQPLKGAAAKGATGLKKLRGIEKVGREIGVRSTLLKSIPTVLKKALDKRRTADGIVIEEFETEVAKHYTELAASLNDEHDRFLECSDAVQEARDGLADAERARVEHIKARDEAEAAIAHGKTALTVARSNLKKLEGGMAKNVRELTRAQARLEVFRSGPVAAVAQLQPEHHLGATLTGRAASDAEMAIADGSRGGFVAAAASSSHAPAPADAVLRPSIGERNQSAQPPSPVALARANTEPAPLAGAEPTPSSIASTVPASDAHAHFEASRRPPSPQAARPMECEPSAVERPAAEEAAVAFPEPAGEPVTFVPVSRIAYSSFVGDEAETLAWAQTEMMTDA